MLVENGGRFKPRFGITQQRANEPDNSTIQLPLAVSKKSSSKRQELDTQLDDKIGSVTFDRV